MYAATPPLEALKLLVGHAAGHRDGGANILVSDVNRVCFHASAKRELYVELLARKVGHREGYVGRLRLALYGTRDAASLWQECLSQHLESCGFERGRSNLVVFLNAEQYLRCLFRGDDYATVGSLENLVWLRAE